MGQKLTRDNKTDQLPSVQDFLWKQDVAATQALAAQPAQMAAEVGYTKKEFTEAVHPLQKIIVKACFTNAHDNIANRIYARASAKSDQFFSFTGRMPNETRSICRERLRIFLVDTISAIDNVEEVKRLSMEFGAYHIRLRRYGFKPDFFAIIADMVAAECVFLGGNATAMAPAQICKAWTAVLNIQFDAVREGYYKELRKLRKHTQEGTNNSTSINSTSIDLDSPIRSSTERRRQFRCQTGRAQREQSVESGDDQASNGSSSPSSRRQSRSPVERKQSGGCKMIRARSMSSTMSNRIVHNNNNRIDPQQTVESWREINICNESFRAPKGSDSSSQQKKKQQQQRDPSAHGVERSRSSVRKNNATGQKSMDQSQSKYASFKAKFVPMKHKERSPSPDAGEGEEDDIAQNKPEMQQKLRMAKNRHSFRRFNSNRRRSISMHNVFNPDKMLTDFMNDQLNM